MLRALEAGIPASRIVFSGVAKTADEMKLGLTHGIETVRITHRQLATESAFIVASLRQLLSTEPNSRLTRVHDDG